MTDAGLIESMARAITAAKGEDPDSIVSRYDHKIGAWKPDGPLWHDNIDLATAALAAIRAAGYEVVPREPTPAMIAAGWGAINDGRRWPPRVGAGPGLSEAYRAMNAAIRRATSRRGR